MTELRIRAAEPQDADQVLALLPRLHAFPVHERRNPDDLWQHDAKQARAFFAGSAPECFIFVAAVDARPRNVLLVDALAVVMGA